MTTGRLRDFTLAAPNPAGLDQLIFAPPGAGNADSTSAEIQYLQVRPIFAF